MKELIEKKTEGLDIPITFIPNWAELETVSPTPREQNALLGELGLADKFVFLYAGNMGYPNDLESIVWCAEKLRKEEQFHFIFLGAGVKKAWLTREVAAMALTNITVLEPKPRSEQAVFLNACDVALVSLVKKMWGVSMPSRTYNILAAGKPILALTEPGSELAQVIADDNVGWVVPPCEPEKLSAAIHEIYSKRNELKEMGARARNAGVKKYSTEAAVRGYFEVLR
jgi:glycosyltransferase involved in cell wall biosynthesis